MNQFLYPSQLYYYPHFTDEKTEAWGSSVTSQDLNPGLMAPVCRQRPLGCDNSPWVLPDRPPCGRVSIVTGLLGLRVMSHCGSHTVGERAWETLLVLLLVLGSGFYIKRKQIRLQKDSKSSLPPPPPPQKAKRHQLERFCALLSSRPRFHQEQRSPGRGAGAHQAQAEGCLWRSVSRDITMATTGSPVLSRTIAPLPPSWGPGLP